MATFSKGKAVWLCRDGDGGYVVMPREGPAPAYDAPYWLQEENEFTLSAQEVHDVFGHHPLRPGGGPLKVRLSLEVVE